MKAERTPVQGAGFSPEAVPSNRREKKVAEPAADIRIKLNARRDAERCFVVKGHLAERMKEAGMERYFRHVRFARRLSRKCY